MNLNYATLAIAILALTSAAFNIQKAMRDDNSLALGGAIPRLVMGGAYLWFTFWVVDVEVRTIWVRTLLILLFTSDIFLSVYSRVKTRLL